jgi:hypothetical protein
MQTDPSHSPAADTSELPALPDAEGVAVEPPRAEPEYYRINAGRLTFRECRMQVRNPLTAAFA